MIKVGKKIVKYRITILIIGILLLIPSVLGYLKTRVNYDILYYLPGNIDTMKGQDILIDEFQKGSIRNGNRRWHDDERSGRCQTEN